MDEKEIEEIVVLLPLTCSDFEIKMNPRIDESVKRKPQIFSVAGEVFFSPRQ